VNAPSRRTQNCHVQLSLFWYCSIVVAPSGDFWVYSASIL